MKTTKLAKTSSMIAAMAFVICLANSGHATFSQVYVNVGDTLYLTSATDAASSTGNVGSNGGTDALVDISVTGNADFANGNGTIKPASGATLTQLIFTPENESQFCGFSFHAQLDVHGNDTATITLVVTSQYDVETQFTYTGSGNASDAFGVTGSGGDTIKSVKISAASPGFDEVKLSDFDFCTNTTSVPEPTTLVAGALLLLPFGVSTLRIMRRNRQT